MPTCPIVLLYNGLHTQYLEAPKYPACTGSSFLWRWRPQHAAVEVEPGQVLVRMRARGAGPRPGRHDSGDWNCVRGWRGCTDCRRHLVCPAPNMPPLPPHMPVDNLLVHVIVPTQRPHNGPGHQGGCGGTKDGGSLLKETRKKNREQERKS